MTIFRSGLLVFIVPVFQIGSTVPVLAEKCHGMWDFGTATSVEFLSDRKIRYCFAASCADATYTKSQTGVIKFGFATGAKVTLLPKKSKKYRALYKKDNRTFYGKIQCR